MAEGAAFPGWLRRVGQRALCGDAWCRFDCLSAEDLFYGLFSLAVLLEEGLQVFELKA